MKFFENNHNIPLSISETARLFGLSEKTIRRAIKNNEILAITIKDRYKLQFNDVLNWSQKRPRLQTMRDSKGIGQFMICKKTAKSSNVKNQLSNKQQQLFII